MTGSGTAIVQLGAISTSANEAMQVSVAVYDRAGNRNASTRRALQDATAPSITLGVNSAFTATTLPTWNITHTARRIGTVALGLTYHSELYRYPATTIGTAWTSAFTPTSGAIVSGTSTPTAPAGTAVLTVPVAAPFMLGVSTGASGALYTAISAATTVAKSVSNTVCVTCGTDTYNAASVPVPAALTSTTAISGVFSVSASLAAANGAGAGLKATQVGAATTATNWFSRVDFYEKNGNDYDYVGSSTSPVTTVSDAGVPTFTWLIGSYAAADWNGNPITPASSGREYRAIGVRSNGGGDRAVNAVINGAILAITTQAPVGVTASVTVTGPSNFSQVVTAAGAGTGVPVVTRIPVTNFGTYTVTPASVNGPNGEAYTPDQPAQPVIASGNGSFSPANPIAYALTANLMRVSVAGLPAGVSTTITASKTGEANVTSVVTGTGIANTVSTVIALPSAGGVNGVPAWTATVSINSITDGSTALVYTPALATGTNCAGVTVTFGANAANANVPCAFTYNQTAFYLPVSIALGSGVPTLTPAVTFTPTTGSARSLSAVQATRNLVFSSQASSTGASAVDPGATTVTVTPVAVNGITYGSAAIANQTPSQGAPTALAITYAAARATVQFTGANLADLSGFTAPIALVGPLGTQSVNVAQAINNTATTAQVLTIAGTYTVQAIPSIVIGSCTYAFTPATVGATYGATQNILVTVTRTCAGNAISGTMTTNATAATTADWSDAAVQATPALGTRVVTFGSQVGLTGAGSTVAFSCVSSVPGLITEVFTAPGGVPTCTLTLVNGAVMGGTPVTVTLTATGGGAGLNVNQISSTLSINRIP